MSPSNFDQAKSGLLVLGGSFNPIHPVHLQMTYDVAKHLKLREALIVPNFQSPGKAPIEELSGPDRFNIIMRELNAFQDKHPPPPFLTASQIELNQKKKVFTIDTLKTISQIDSNLYFLMGLDQFETFASWKDYEEILKLVQVVVVNRDGHQWPKEAQFDHDASPQVSIYKWAGQSEILFFKQKYDLRSATEIRKLISTGEVDHPWLKDYQPETLEALQAAYGARRYQAQS